MSDDNTTGCEVDEAAAEAVDYVAIDADENLLIEFAATGVKKRFLKICLKSVERTIAPTYVHSVYLDDEGSNINLMIESQEFDYSNMPKLRQCVIEQFSSMEHAKAALTKIKIAMGQKQVGDTDKANFRSKKSYDDSKAKAAIGLLISAAIAILIGGAGAFMGGLALFHKFYN